MSPRVLIAAAIALLGLAAPAAAQDLMIARSAQPFPEAMTALQDAIASRGYKVSRVQRVDVGLEGRGYKTDKYRVVFYGKPEEVARLAASHPDLIPFLPLSVAIFAEEDETILVTTNPALYAGMFPQPELKPVFVRWERDLAAIMESVRKSGQAWLGPEP